MGACSLLLLVLGASAASALPRWPGRWTPAAPSPGPHYEAATAVVGGKLYAFAGYKDGQWRVDRAYESYDPATDAWTALGSLPAGMPETHLGIATDGDVIYIAGGFGGDLQNTMPSQWISDQVWRYAPATNTWTLLTHLPQPRGAGQLDLVGRQLHYDGGNPADRFTDMPEHFVYDLDTGQWSTAAPMPDPKDHFASVVLDDRIYAVAGEHGHDIPGLHQQQTTVHVYDPASDRWTQLASTPTPVSHIEGSTFVSDGRIIVAGGQVGAFDATGAAFAYDPGSDRWSSLAPALPAMRQGTIVQRIGQQVIFTLGAARTDQPQASTWIGQLPAPTLPVNTGLPSAGSTAAVGVPQNGHGGSWTDAVTITDQWQSCPDVTRSDSCTPDPGATSLTYTPTPADSGRRLRVVETATSDAGSIAAASPMTSVVTGGPVVQATAKDNAACRTPHALNVRWTVPAHIRLRTLRVSISGHRFFTLRGDRRKLTITAPVGRRVQVRLRARSTSGKTLAATRTYDACATAPSGALRLHVVGA